MRLGATLAAAALVIGVAEAGDAPEISRSLGRKDGIVVLWPRVSGEVPADAAAQVQAALVRIASATGRRVDVRPVPERVCPRETGCRAPTLGAVVTGKGGGCAVVATVSAPGQSPATLVPWVSHVTLKTPTAAFREPPESQVVVTDFAACDTLGGVLATDPKGLGAVLTAAIGG